MIARSSQVLLLSSFLLVGVAGGCRRADEPASRPAPAAAASTDSRPAEIDRLLALPYAGYAQGEDDDGDGVVIRDAEASCPGYNLYVLHARSTAELIDEEGHPVRQWHYRPSQLWANGELLPSGDFVVVGADPSGLPGEAIADASRYVLRFNWAGDLLWKRSLTAHHDIEVTPQGQLLTLSFARRVVPEIDPAIPVRDDRVTLLSPDGQVQATLALCDVLAGQPERFPLRRPRPYTFGSEPWIDLFHCNSVEWMRRPDLARRAALYGPDNILVCSRHQDRIFVVNWATRELVWAWGQGELQGPHDAQVLDNGNILVFDNGVARGWSRVIELDPLQRRIVWEYHAPHPADLFTISRGACQRLPNGNTLITNSDNGIAFEVTPTGRTVWEFRCPQRDAQGRRATIVRCTRYKRAVIDRMRRQFGATEP